MRATLRVLGGAALVAAFAVLTACQPNPVVQAVTQVVAPPPPAPTTTAPPTCEQLAAADWLRADGYQVSCRPTFAAPSGVRGWTDHATRTVWIWPDGLSTAALTKLLDHEHGHVLAELRGLTFPSQADEERWADGHSYCHAGPQNGIGYSLRPADCSPYR